MTRGLKYCCAMCGRSSWARSPLVRTPWCSTSTMAPPLWFRSRTPASTALMVSSRSPECSDPTDAPSSGPLAQTRPLPNAWPGLASKSKSSQRHSTLAPNAARSASTWPRSLPISRLKVLEEFAPHVLPGIEAGDDRIHDPRRAVNNVQGRVKAVVANLARRDLFGVFVRDPTRIDAVHVDAVGVVIRRRGAGHHVQRRLRHIGVGMARGLGLAIELPLDRRDIHRSEERRVGKERRS